MGKITEQINQIKKLFKECGFYYSRTYKLFKPIQYQEISSKDADYEHFIWNQQLINEFANIGGD